MTEKERARRIAKASKEITLVYQASAYMKGYDWFDHKGFKTNFNSFVTNVCKRECVKEDYVRKILAEAIPGR